MHLLLLSITSKKRKKERTSLYFSFQICVCADHIFSCCCCCCLFQKNNIINNHVFCNVKSQTDVLIWLPVFFLSLYIYVSLLLFFFAFIFYYLKNLIFLSLFSFCCFFARSNFFFIIVALLFYDDYNDVITIDRIDIDIHATLMRNSIL